MKLRAFVKKQNIKHTAASVLLVLIVVCVGLLGANLKLVTGSLVTILALVAIPVTVYFYSTAYSRIKNIDNKLTISNKRLKNKAGYFESILQDSTDIIFTLDIDGFILKFNKGAESNFGYTQVEIVGKPFKKLFINEADEQRIYDKVLRDGRISNMELAMKNADGEAMFVSLSLSEMKNDYGKIIGLVATCKNITEKKRLEQELVRKNKLLEELSITDSLTGLYNSRHFYEMLQRELNRMKRQDDARLSLLMIDIDLFKSYNDVHGHQAGDKVIRTLGKVIPSSIRQDIDTGYRYGGDEFTVILPNTGKEHARRVSERIKHFYDLRHFEPTDLSIGIAETDGSLDKEALVKLADEEMYKSKKNRR